MVAYKNMPVMMYYRSFKYYDIREEVSLNTLKVPYNEINVETQRLLNNSVHVVTFSIRAIL